MTKHTIEMDAPTKAFYNGVAVANDVRKTLDEMPGFDLLPFEQRQSLFWLFVGLNADRDLASAHQDTFIQGVGTQALQRAEQLVLVVDLSGPTFEGDDNTDDGEACKHELNRILRDMLRDDAFGWGDAGTLYDKDGNRAVGTWKIH